MACRTKNYGVFVKKNEKTSKTLDFWRNTQRIRRKVKQSGDKDRERRNVRKCVGRKRKKMPGKSGAKYERWTGDREVRVAPRGK
jgi:hypothetical protein